LPVQRLSADPRWVSAVARARPDPRGVAGPCRVSWCRPSSAFVAPSAPASPVRDRASRSSSCDLTPSLRPELLSWGFALLQSRSVNRLPLLRHARPFVFANDRRPAEPGISPLLGSCSLERNNVGCPFFASPRSLDRSKVGEGRQAPTGAVLRVLAPLDGSGCRTRHARILANPPSPWRPDASRPCFMPLASLESPFRAFPSRGAVPALAGLLLPCGFALDPPNGAARTEVFAAPFADRADLSPRLAREGWPDQEAGTTVPRSR